MTDPNPGKPKLKTQNHSYTRFILLLDRLIKVIESYWDTLLTYTVERSGNSFAFVINLYSSALAWILKKDSNSFRKWPFLIIRCAVILPTLALFFIPLLFLILFTGTIFSVLGLRNSGRYSFKEQFYAWATLLFILSVAPWIFSPYILYKISLVLVYSVGVIGLNMLLGQCGIISLGQGGFLLTGGYFVTWLSKGILGFEIPLLLAIILGSLLNALVGILFGLPALRVKDNYLVIVTMCFTLATPMILKSHFLVALSGARQGGLFFEDNLFPSYFSNFPSHVTQYFFVAIICMVLFFIAYNIIHHSQIGRAFQIIKCDTEVTAIMGIPVVRYKLFAFALSAVYAGFAGGLFMVLTKFISPDSYSLHTSVDYLVANVIGGVGGIFGSVVGGLFLSYDLDLVQYASTIFPKAKDIAHASYGFILILIVLFAPLGIAGQLSKGTKFLFRKRPVRNEFTFSPPPDFDYLEPKKDYFPPK